MAKEMTTSQVTEQATAIHSQFTNLRLDAERRYKQYTLRKNPTIPEDIAREGQINVLSPLVIHSAHSIRADLMMNPTEVIVTPLAREAGGGLNREHVKMADNLEKSMAILWSTLNEGRRVDREIIWHQLVSPFGVMLLECDEPDIPDQGDLEDDEYVALLERHAIDYMPWSVSCPDPMTCSFLMHKGQPTVFVRKYKQLVREVAEKYSNRKGIGEGKNLVMSKQGVWNWQEVSSDYVTNEYRQTVGDIREVEMIYLDDGKNIYHVALNPGAGKTGQMVWCGPNPFGRVAAFIVASNTTPLRKPEDAFEPFLWPLMQTVEQINTIRTIRATSARNESSADDYITLDPQVIKMLLDSGKELPEFHSWKKSGNETPYFYGVLNQRQNTTSVDYDKLEMRLNEDLQRFLPSSFVNVLDPAVLKSATASSILHAAEAGVRVYGPLMSAYDAQIRSLLEAIVYSCEHHYKDEDFQFFATGDEMARGKNLKAGSGYSFSSKAVSFPYKLAVKTRSMTQAQASAQYEMVLKQRILPDGTPGPATLEDLIDAANFTDKAAQMEKIAIEQLMKFVDPQVQQLALAASMVDIEFKTGLKLPIGGEEPQAQPEQTEPKPIGNLAQRMDAPFVTGPTGGSDRNV